MHAWWMHGRRYAKAPIEALVGGSDWLQRHLWRRRRNGAIFTATERPRRRRIRIASRWQRGCHSLRYSHPALQRYELILRIMQMNKKLIEGSLEVKLPTIWTDEKQRREESEKRREEERRSKKRKSQKKEDPSARKGRQVAKHRFSTDLWPRVFFHWFVAQEGRKVGSLKRRVRSHVARWWTLRSHKMYKTHQVRTTFGGCDVEKVHAVVARSTFPSQNAQNTQCSDHFWKLRCRKSARRCGAKHISKSKAQKTAGYGAFLDVQMCFRVAGARDCGPCQEWEGFVAFPKTMTGVGHLKRICKDAFSMAGAVQVTCSSELLGGPGADFLRRVAFWSIRCVGLLKWFCVTGASLRMTWHHFFVAGTVL